jgi:hypothetical protein
MPRQAPKLKSRNSIERRNAAEAHSAIKPNLRRRGRSRVSDYRFQLERLGHGQQGKRVGAAASAECIGADASLRRQVQQSLESCAWLLELKKIASSWDASYSRTLGHGSA